MVKGVKILSADSTKYGCDSWFFFFYKGIPFIDFISILVSSTG